MLPLDSDALSTDPRDDAVSPVIAVILMVAITVVLAATVYVWVSGFTDTGGQAPSANFEHIDCNSGFNAGNQTTIRLTSGGPLQKDDTHVILFNRSTSPETQEAETDPINSSGTWSTGTQLTFADPGSQADGPSWDSNLTSDGGLGDGDQYRMDFIHKPTESTYATPPWTC
jgi:flagellin-like protein